VGKQFAHPPESAGCLGSDTGQGHFGEVQFLPALVPLDPQQVPLLVRLGPSLLGSLL